jgi:putative transposase
LVQRTRYDEPMPDLEKDIWYWYHNISECYYHIQLTVKYRRSVFEPHVEKVFIDTVQGFKERYAIEISEIGFDQNHVHLLCRFLPKYSGGQVIKLIKNITAKAICAQTPSIKKFLWGGEFWTDGYYIATIGAKGNKTVIENYIRKQGRGNDIAQLKLFTL